MRMKIGIIGTAIFGAAACWVAATPPAVGPDVVAFYVANSINELGSSGGIGGYAIGTTSCNYGDMEADWYGGTNDTPCIFQNAYRLHGGRFEQIGASWGKHSFCALSEGGCGDCQPTNCSTLGIGCADTYSAGLNTNPTAPRSEMNAFSGYYDYPFNVSPSGPSVLRGNIQIADDDLEPSLWPGARWFFEGYYMSSDDAAWGNHANNASWREINVSGPGNVSAIGGTNVEEQAIRVWKQIDPTVIETEIQVPGEGFFILAAKVTDIGAGMWRYEYALWNHNSHRSAGSFSVPMPAGATLQNIDFKDVDYHSGEIYDNTDWTTEVQPGSITWSTVPYASNPNANALRFGTLYNFRFEANVAPETSPATIGLFRPGDGDSVTASTIAPPAAPVDPCDLPLGACPSDINGDETVNVSDLLTVLNHWGECGDGTFRPVGDADGDCCVSVNDLLVVIADWGMDCAPIGACCLDDGTCDATTESACADAGGTWQGESSTCASASCPQPGACCLDETKCAVMLQEDCVVLGGDWRGPSTDCAEVDCAETESNDECADAWLVSDGLHDFSTAGATTDGPSHSQCKWGGQTYHDIWYRYVASCTGMLTVSTCNLVNYDSDLVVYDGWSCDDLYFLDCNDDGDGCSGYSSHLVVPVSAGQNILIRVGGWESGDTGSGQLLIDCNPGFNGAK